jgi:hypothetical protein
MAVVRAADLNQPEKLDGNYNMASGNEGLPPALPVRNLTVRTRRLDVEHAWSNPGLLRTSTVAPFRPVVTVLFGALQNLRADVS